MNSASILYFFIALHGVFMLSILIYKTLSDSHLRSSYYLWMSMIPVFGPLAGCIIIKSIVKPTHLMKADPKSVKKMNSPRHQIPVNQVVPLEEALLIDDPKKRRALMMHVLRSDPMQYLDLLLVARFNDDVETAHYATATIMEVQRRFQMRIHQMQAELARSGGNVEEHREYALYLSAYCESGLLQGQLLMRQRMMLKKALESILRLEKDPALIQIMIKNCLALGDMDEAKTAAQSLMTKWPLDELSWFEGMRVCAEARDKISMQFLFERMKNIPIDFTAKGHEQMLFWKERIK